MIPLRTFLVRESWQSRSTMPQIKSDDVDNYLNYLKSCGINHQRETVNPNALMPSQPVDMDKVKKMMEDESCLIKPIMVDHNYRILDGHHRWKANHELRNTINIIRIGAEWNRLYDHTKDYLELAKERYRRDL